MILIRRVWHGQAAPKRPSRFLTRLARLIVFPLPPFHADTPVHSMRRLPEGSPYRNPFRSRRPPGAAGVAVCSSGDARLARRLDDRQQFADDVLPAARPTTGNRFRGRGRRIVQDDGTDVPDPALFGVDGRQTQIALQSLQASVEVHVLRRLRRYKGLLVHPRDGVAFRQRGAACP